MTEVVKPSVQGKVVSVPLVFQLKLEQVVIYAVPIF